MRFVLSDRLRRWSGGDGSVEKPDLVVDFDFERYGSVQRVLVAGLPVAFIEKLSDEWRRENREPPNGWDGRTSMSHYRYRFKAVPSDDEGHAPKDWIEWRYANTRSDAIAALYDFAGAQVVAKDWAWRPFAYCGW